MLADLFRPAWKSRSVEKRRKAVAEMNGAGAEHREILVEMARDDEEPSIRIAAIRQLTSVTVVHGLSKEIADSAVRAEAEQRVNELMGMEHALDEAQFRDLSRQYPELQSRIAAHARLIGTADLVLCRAGAISRCPLL